MSDLKNLLFEFEKILKENKLEFSNIFRRGLANDEIFHLLSQIGVLSDEKLQVLYTWHDGIKYDAGWKVGENNFFSFGVMLALEDVIEHCHILKQSINLKSSLLPLFASGNGDYVLYQAEKKSIDFGRLYLHAPSLTLSEMPVVIYDSLENLIITVVECYKEEVYTIADDGTLNVDFKLEQTVSRRINGNVEFWD